MGELTCKVQMNKRRMTLGFYADSIGKPVYRAGRKIGLTKLGALYLARLPGLLADAALLYAVPKLCGIDLFDPNNRDVLKFAAAYLTADFALRTPIIYSDHLINCNLRKPSRLEDKV